MFTPIIINRSGDPIGQKENGAINVAMPSLKIHIVQVRSLLDCYAEILPTGLFSRKKRNTTQIRIFKSTFGKTQSDNGLPKVFL